MIVLAVKVEAVATAVAAEAAALAVGAVAVGPVADATVAVGSTAPATAGTALATAETGAVPTSAESSVVPTPSDAVASSAQSALHVAAAVFGAVPDVLAPAPACLPRVFRESTRTLGSPPCTYRGPLTSSDTADR